MKSVWVMGLMSGTSLDGIDGALIKTDGVIITERGPGYFLPYATDFRKKLYELIKNPANNPNIKVIEAELTALHAGVVRELSRISGIKAEYIGFHGQTIYHQPKEKLTAAGEEAGVGAGLGKRKNESLGEKLAKTVQIGDGLALTNMLQTPVVYDFRINDVAAGGEGAPLVPIYHAALIINHPKPLAVVNIGGVANVTVIDSNNRIYAGDVGPGGALIDDWVKLKVGQPYDDGGQIAAQGKINQPLLNNWFNNPFFERPLPKSLDRQTFQSCFQDCADNGLSIPDGAATLTAFTAAAIIKGLVPYFPLREVILSGGGRHNLFLRQLIGSTYFREMMLNFEAIADSPPLANKPNHNSLAQNFSGHNYFGHFPPNTPGEYMPIKLAEDLGWCGDKMEAEAFAYLAIRSLRGLPLTFPTTTGVAQPVTGGRVAGGGGIIAV